MSSNFNFEEEKKKRGYLEYKIIANEPYVFRIKDDDTLIEIISQIDNILDDPLYPTGILSGGSIIVCYPTKESKSLTQIIPNPDLECDIVREGKFIFKINNKFLVEFKPVLVQVARTGKKLLGNIPEYQINMQIKQFLKTNPT